MRDSTPPSRVDDQRQRVVVKRSTQHHSISLVALERLAQTSESGVPSLSAKLIRIQYPAECKGSSVGQGWMLQRSTGMLGTTDEQRARGTRPDRPQHPHSLVDQVPLGNQGQADETGQQNEAGQ
jgi:hypothetical protein